ncbi:MAG: universal stress protein [Kiloniellaceae bacterium]
MKQKQILVATDFSTRSDRAIRRATLLAKDIGARLTLVHVVDDDQPRRIVQAERSATDAILEEQARTLQKADGLECDSRLVQGDPFEGIAQAADDRGADLVVIGPHRRQALKDIFIGTTAERTIRNSSRPVLMTNGIPAGSYQHVLIAVDLSECSADAVRALLNLGLERRVAVSVVYVIDSIADGEADASRKLDSFLASIHFDPIRRIVKPNESLTAATINKAARECTADLLVVGTHGRTGVADLLLGSVAQEVLRTATIDVLAVPPQRKG